ncbi:MAG: hypothetical protein E3K32_13325 [wastewater metagenome]|nr:hypothetical protein [Candidatus Loosdrechtia aerotolerans]
MFKTDRKLRKSELEIGAAIRRECRLCGLVTKELVCFSDTCCLNDTSMPILERVKRYCLGCAGSGDEVEKCSGVLLGGKKCSLHEYRV